MPQPVTGLTAALIVLGVILFASPPAARLWIAALVLAIAVFAKGRDAAAIINDLRRKVYGR